MRADVLAYVIHLPAAVHLNSLGQHFFSSLFPPPNTHTPPPQACSTAECVERATKLQSAHINGSQPYFFFLRCGVRHSFIKQTLAQKPTVVALMFNLSPTLAIYQ